MFRLFARIRNFFSVEHMVKPENRKGDLPTSKEAYRNLTRIAIPSVVEMVFMSLIGSVDVIMISPLGYQAIAAVGLVNQPRMLILSLFFALDIGVTAIVARRKGEDLPGDANQTLRNALVIIIGLSVVIVTLALSFSRQLMQLAGAESDTINQANEYFRILVYFLPINALTMCINAAQRGVGNTRTTMIVNIAANVVNIFFNFLFIYKFGWGVAGDAWATGLGFVVGFVLCIVSLFGKRFSDMFLKLSIRDNWRLKKETVLSIFRVGGNAMIEQVALRVGFFTYAIIVAKLGTEAFAAHQVGMQYLNLSFNFGDGIGVAGTALVGQMLGQNRPDLSTIYGKCSQRLALCVALVMCSMMVIFRYPLAAIFINPNVPANAVAFPLAAGILIMVALFQPFQTSSVVISGCLRGAGDNLHVALVMIICVVGIRPTLAALAIFGFHLGLVGAWSASLVDMIIRLTLMYKRFNSGKWQVIKV
ncbi:MATE family efflux transporter [Clostridia bacterium]|nr:MATE family efflux transporter [Clostridia bacterium]